MGSGLLARWALVGGFALALGCSEDKDTSPDAGQDVGVDVEVDGVAAEASVDGPVVDAAPGLVVETQHGKVRGEVSGDFAAFRSIPYAAPPIGPLRWKPPQPPEAWSEVRDATTFGASCPQSPPINGLDPPFSEDCLTATVWTPNPLPKEAAPVMVWIHGGGYYMGGAAWWWTSGKHLAAKMGVIVVAINYRLGPLGFLAHSSFGEGSGNFGVLDQQLALKWVKDNIDAFGGDPANVTLFGNSSGGVSVCTHLTSAQSKGLFHNAIIQSGPCGLVGTKADAEAVGALMAEKVGCAADADVAKCLRSKPPEELATALKRKDFRGNGDVTWGPMVDGAVLSDHPITLLQAGSFNKVPLIIGANKDEASTDLVAYKTLMTEELYKAMGKQMFGDKDAEVLAQYPLDDYDSAAHAAAAVGGDRFAICPTRETARAVAATNTSTYLYHFTHMPSFTADPFLGAYHVAELWMVFHTSDSQKGFGRTDEEAAFSMEMMGYWTRFARTGDPNGDGAVAWPVYEEATDEHLTFDLTIEAGSKLKQDKCDFWAAF